MKCRTLLHINILTRSIETSSLRNYSRYVGRPHIDAIDRVGRAVSEDVVQVPDRLEVAVPDSVYVLLACRARVAVVHVEGGIVRGADGRDIHPCCKSAARIRLDLVGEFGDPIR